MVDRATFTQQARDIFAHLDDRPHLRTHPLARLLVPPGEAGVAEALRRAIVGAIEELRPPEPILPRSPGWRRYRYLRRRYVDGADPDQIARELDLSERQCRRIQGPAIEAAAAVLWESYLRLAPAIPEAAAEPARPPAASGVPAPGDDALERELARAAAEQPNEPTRTEEVLGGALRTVASLATSHQVELTLDTARPLALVTVQRIVLRQILLSLLSHAIGLARGARVEVKATNTPQAVEVEIAARWRGPVRGQAGDASARVAAVAEISAARRLAELQGAALYVEAPDETTLAFHLTLPSARAATVLVVDDNPDVARLVQRYLAGTSYRLIQARTGREALQQTREARPEVVLLDVLLPAEDGWEVLEELKTDPATRDVPVIVCSVVPDKLLALSLGVVDFLPKPVTRASLLSALDRCCGAGSRADSPARPESSA